MFAHSAASKVLAAVRNRRSSRREARLRAVLRQSNSRMATGQFTAIESSLISLDGTLGPQKVNQPPGMRPTVSRQIFCMSGRRRSGGWGLKPGRIGEKEPTDLFRMGSGPVWGSSFLTPDRWLRPSCWQPDFGDRRASWSRARRGLPAVPIFGTSPRPSFEGLSSRRRGVLRHARRLYAAPSALSPLVTIGRAVLPAYARPAGPELP